MNKQELIEKIESLPAEDYKYRPYIDKKVVLALVRQLDEPEKIVVPQFVADWIEKCENEEKSLLNALLYTPEGVNSWVGNSENQETFALAWIFGYEVEKEKIYTVKVKAGLGQYLERYYLNNEELTPQFKRTQPTGSDELPTFTRKELESTGFGWVFDCEGIEIEEVE